MLCSRKGRKPALLPRIRNAACEGSPLSETYAPPLFRLSTNESKLLVCASIVAVPQTSHRYQLAVAFMLAADVAALAAVVSFDRETVSAERGGAATPSSQVSALEGPRRPGRYGSEIGAVRLHFEVRFRGFCQRARLAIRSYILKPDVLVVAGRTHS
jgi:hypothetical protein